MKRVLSLLALLVATTALAADNPVTCSGTSCKIRASKPIMVDGSTDETQFTVQAHSTQSSSPNVVVVETSVGTDLFTVNVDGRVNLGSDAGPPAGTNLSIGESTADTVGQVNITQASTGDAGIALVISGATAWTMGVDNSDSDSLVFGDNGSGTIGSDTVMKLATNGDVGIPSINTEARVTIDHSGTVGEGAMRLVADNSSNQNGTLNVLNGSTSASSSTVGINIFLSGLNDATNSVYVRFRDNDTSPSGSIQAASATTVAYNTSSDGRLKKDVEDFPSGLATVMEMKPRKYRWKEDNHEDRGFIAQELKTVYPYAVSGKEEDGLQAPMMIDYGKLTPVLAAAIQEQQAQIEALRQELEALRRERAP
jgi:hypothetical protein